MININKEEKHQEALKRMELLNIDFDVIQDFKDNGTVYMSINGFNIPVFDFLIDEIVAKTNLKNPYVYYLIQDDAKMVSILFVSNYKEDWEAESLSIV